METVNIALMTDQTGQQIVKGLREHNAILEAAFGKVNENPGNITGMFVVDASVEHNEDGSYKGLVLATTIETTIENIRVALESEKIVILRVADNEASTSYFAPLSKAVGLSTDSVSIEFGSVGTSNPSGSAGRYSLTYVKGLDFMTGFKVAPDGLNASSIACNVTVGGKTYRNAADALEAMAALHQ